ncbi:hypothetical protein ACFORH_43245 [Amycolatopsis roodepoortensis]|uniref:Uncharacterized protein n=1 Tax=Amycolatopsis roodepoortensis TaxID=700274 RepID=A0ABR9LIC9_9PSEU|nr:hypothetical protein [Amycolatopsis roodepoortensis]MBE1580441.1 hypothetical protein [Amycolatopsis roodepoortensis]
MWLWVFVGGYAVFVATLAACCLRVALSRHSTKPRRDMAYKMFRLIWGVNLLGGLATAVVKLHQAGLLL